MTDLMMLGKAAERRLLKDIQRTYDEVVEMGRWPMDLLALLRYVVQAPRAGNQSEHVR